MLAIELSKELKSRILKSLMISCLFPLLLLMGLSYYLSLNRTSKILVTDLMNSAERAASLTRSWRIRQEADLKWLMSQLSHTGLDFKKQKELLLGFTNNNQDVGFSGIIDVRGNNVARSDQQPFKNYRDRNYMQDALHGQISSETVIGRNYKQPLLCTAGPITQKNVIVGAVYVCSFIRVLSKEVGYTAKGSTGYIFLVDEDNNKLIHPKTNYTDTAFTDAEKTALQAFRNGKIGAFEFTDKDGENYISYLYPVQHGWAAVGLQKRSEISETAIQSLMIPTLLGLLVVFIGIVLTYILVERATRPLQYSSIALKQKVNEQSQQLIYAAKMSSLGEMASGIAHEVNNPLAIISLITQNMRNKFHKAGSDPELLEQLNKIDMTCNRITKIVKGLKTFSRNGSQDPMYRENLLTILEDTYSLCAESLRNRGISLRLHCPPELALECQPVQLSQVFVNLIMNAKDAVKDLPQKWIEIQASQILDRVYIKCTDSGHGIPLEIREKIMDPFYTTKKVGEGTGLGLSISKGIIECHQGQIWYNPEAKNTQFCLVLPISQNQSEKPSIGMPLESTVIV